MFRILAVFLLLGVSAWSATIKLYLSDGSFQLVREYQVTGDRVRFYSVERSEWEEIPLSLADLKRTKAEHEARQEDVRKNAEAIAAEEKVERELREELDRVPMEKGVYLVEGTGVRIVKQAETKVATRKGRAVLKVLSPVPIISGKAEVELEGEHSQTVVTGDSPEFYIRLSEEQRFGLVRLGKKKGARVVQNWTIVPVTKEIVEEQQDVEVFRKQMDDGLYKIWPAKPLEPGEYAVIEYTEGKGNVQVWDFAYRK
jgi:hypothetical protein